MTPEIGHRSEALEQSLIELAVEGWRFSRLFARVISKLDAGEQSKYANQARYFLKKIDEQLESAGFTLVSVEGQPFDPGVAATALNISEFDPGEHLMVDQMVEPIVMSAEGLRRPGTVMLRKVHL